MAKKTSRLEPQHRYWYEDLPLPGERMEKKPNLEGECNQVNGVFLEVSRAPSFSRGLLLIISALGSMIFFPGFLFLMATAFGSRQIGAGLILLGALIGGGSP